MDARKKTAVRPPGIGRVKDRAGLKVLLDRIYARYNHKRFIPPDPLQFVYRYASAEDREVAGFLASGLAYGRVEQIARSLNDLLGRMDGHPARYAANINASRRRDLCDFKHRFTSGQDVADLLEVLGWAIQDSGSLEAYFLRGYNPMDATLVPSLDRFVASLLDLFTSRHRGPENPGFRYLLARPSAGSACKRLNLFLRWMVRKDRIDTGLWTRVDKRGLVIPMDVHMGRVCRLLGLTDRRTATLHTAVQATHGFAQIEPDDPVKYDFSLCRMGMVEDRLQRVLAEKKGWTIRDTSVYIHQLSAASE